MSLRIETERKLDSYTVAMYWIYSTWYKDSAAQKYTVH